MQQSFNIALVIQAFAESRESQPFFRVFPGGFGNPGFIPTFQLRSAVEGTPARPHCDLPRRVRGRKKCQLVFAIFSLMKGIAITTTCIDGFCWGYLTGK